VDPTNPNHLIGQTKWFVSAEGYNHLLGFYESFDGGKSWSVQGHVPGFEGSPTTPILSELSTHLETTMPCFCLPILL